MADLLDVRALVTSPDTRLAMTAVSPVCPATKRSLW